jgi:hypothetical protein
MGETIMRSSLFNRFFIAAGLASALLAAGCASHTRVHYATYDYFSWNPQVDIDYTRWEHETHREHVDFTVVSNADMRAFWDWEHRKPEQRSKTVSEGNSVGLGGN